MDVCGTEREAQFECDTADPHWEIFGAIGKGIFLLSPVSLFSTPGVGRMAVWMCHHLYSFVKSRFLSGEGRSLRFFLLPELLLSV